MMDLPVRFRHSLVIYAHCSAPRYEGYRTFIMFIIIWGSSCCCLDLGVVSLAFLCMGILSLFSFFFFPFFLFFFFFFFLPEAYLYNSFSSCSSCFFFISSCNNVIYALSVYNNDRRLARDEDEKFL